MTRLPKIAVNAIIIVVVTLVLWLTLSLMNALIMLIHFVMCNAFAT